MLSSERACARAKYYLLSLLSDPQELDWVARSIEEIECFLTDNKTTEVLSCSCKRCTDGRKRFSSTLSNNESSFWVSKMASSKRLFATCIIADLAYSIYSFLQREFNDDWFDGCIDPMKLKADVDLSLENAKLMLDEKEKFFDGGRISLFTYMRSLRPERESPSTDEKNWLIDEFLNLSDKKALETNACARKIPASATIKDLMIRDSPALPRDRQMQPVDGLGEQPVCMQSLGNLALDLTYFLAGGGIYVQKLDASRRLSVNWLKDTDWTALGEIENFDKIFKLLQMMTYTNEEFDESKDDHMKDNFKHISQQFHRIWPRHANEHSYSDIEKERHSDVTSFSSQGFGNPVGCSYIPIEPNTFESMHVRYQREGHQQKKCHLRLFKSIDNNSIQLDLLSFDRDPFKPTSCYASPKHVHFIPLYAYDSDDGLDEFSARFQSVSGSPEKLTIPFIFRFKSMEDVRTFQTAVTGRIIEKDIVINGSSLVFKKKHRLRLNGSPQFYLLNAGRVQLWRVLDKKALKQIHEAASFEKRGIKKYPLRAEIAIFSDRKMFVIGIKCLLRLKDTHDFGLRIETEDKAAKAAMEGSMLCTDSPKYPGLPLFQQQIFNSEEGDAVVCDSIELKFSSTEDRSELRHFLEEYYNNTRPRPSRS